MIVTLLLGVLIGIILGLTGTGGAILSVPALVFSMGWSMQQAAPVALVAVAVSTAIGAAEGLRHKLVRYRAAMLMAAIGMMIAPLGIQTARMVPQQWLGILFAMIMLLVAARLLQPDVQNPGQSADSHKAGRLNPGTGRFHWTWPTRVLLGAIGAFTGFIAGLLGVGGGFVLVPMLRRFTDVSIQGIVATALLVTALVATGAVTSALFQGAILPIGITLLFTTATVIGMLIGRRLSRHVSARQVQLGFAGILFVVAGSLMLKSFV